VKPIGIWASDEGKRAANEGNRASDGEETAADDEGIVMLKRGY